MSTIEFKNGKFQATVNGTVIASPNKQYLKTKIAKMIGSSVSQSQEDAADVVTSSPALEFPINQRFDFVKRLVSMVGRYVTASAIITGEGGLGKSHTVMTALKDAGLQDADLVDADEGTEAPPRGTFRVVKGYSTAKGLFRTLYENRDSIIVFDDCDSILKDADAVNLLKGALDSYDTRTITWNSRSDELPRSFQFNGGVVFISNRSMDKIDQALRTRSMCVDLSMTLDQKIDRMAAIMEQDNFMPGIALQAKKDALTLIDAYKGMAREVSLRTLITVTRIRAEGDSDWQQLATYALVA